MYVFYHFLVRPRGSNIREATNYIVWIHGCSQVVIHPNYPKMVINATKCRDKLCWILCLPRVDQFQDVRNAIHNQLVHDHQLWLINEQLSKDLHSRLLEATGFPAISMRSTSRYADLRAFPSARPPGPNDIPRPAQPIAPLGSKGSPRRGSPNVAGHGCNKSSDAA